MTSNLYFDTLYVISIRKTKWLGYLFPICLLHIIKQELIYPFITKHLPPGSIFYKLAMVPEKGSNIIRFLLNQIVSNVIFYSHP